MKARACLIIEGGIGDPFVEAEASRDEEGVKLTIRAWDADTDQMRAARVTLDRENVLILAEYLRGAVE